MKIAVLGTGMVGKALATKLVEVGHEVVMGSRTADNAEATAWAAATGAAHATFADAAGRSDVIVNATAGAVSLEALATVGAEALADKVLVDVANPIAPDSGMPPTLSVANTDSLGEQIQRAYPEAKVVKTLNTMNCMIMVDPTRVPGDHVVFVGGDSAEAKDIVRFILGEFGWPGHRIIDLGGIESSRGVEMYLAIWLRMWGGLGTGDFNIAIARS